MGMITTLDPYGGKPPIVDKMIGDAYDTVKHVYDHMEDVFAVAAAVKSSNVGEPLLVQRGLLQTGATGLAGATIEIDFEDLGVVHTNILASHVRIIGNTSGELFFADSGYFTSKITSRGLSLTLDAAAPLEVRQAILQWFYIYGG